MSGSLKRAFGLWIASQVAGLHVYADDLANAEDKYPACTVTELEYSLSRVGCGKRDFQVRDEDTGCVTESGKVLRAETTYRLTVKAPSNEDGNGQEQVDTVVEQLAVAVMVVGLERGQFVLEDTGTDPVTSFPVERIAVDGRQAVPADVSGEPFLYRGALTVTLARLVPLAMPVEHVMERIHVEAEGG